jgi:Luciferase-like monooxygenase
VRHCVYTPNYGVFADAAALADLAVAAEGAGWDGFMIYDILDPGIGAGNAGSEDAEGAPRGGVPVVDAWIALATIASRTSRVRIGALVTPLPRRRPITLARQIASVDRLSNGRLVLGVGTGVVGELQMFHEETDTRTRAAMVDEGLEVLAGLWTGQPFTHEGEHYIVRDATFRPTPTQVPRVPVWIGVDGPRPDAEPLKRPLRRAARWDGVLAISSSPGFYDDGYLTPEQITGMLRYLASVRETHAPFDVVFISGSNNSPTPTPEVLAAYEAVGVTWWLRNAPHDLDRAFEFVRQGPPGHAD